MLDVAALMTYDQHGPWSGRGPIAAMPWVRAELRYFMTRVPRRKIDLGAAALRLPVGRWSTPSSPSRRRGDSPARGPCGASASVSGTPACPNGRTLWWDDARSVELRRRVAVAQGLHGLAIWEIGSSARLR